MADPSWSLARIAELEERITSPGDDFHPFHYMSGSDTPNSSTSRFFRSRSNSHAGSSSNSLRLSLSGSRPATPPRPRDDSGGNDSAASSRLDIHVKQIVEHVVVTSAVSLPLPDNTPNKIYDFYQSTCNCEGFYTVFSAASEHLAYYATVNVITYEDIRRKQKTLKKAARNAASQRKKNGFLGISTSGKKGRDKSPTPSLGSRGGGGDEWSEIDLLVRNPDNIPTANIRLQTADKFDRVHIDVPGLSPWTLHQSGIVNPTWEVAVNGIENGFVWKRSSSAKSSNPEKNGRESSATIAGGRPGSGPRNLKLVHESTDETVAEFVAKRGSGFLGKLVVMGDGVDDEAWVRSVVASLLAVLEKMRRTKLEFQTKIDPNWDFAAVKSTTPDVKVADGKCCDRCGIGSAPAR